MLQTLQPSAGHLMPRSRTIPIIRRFLLLDLVFAVVDAYLRGYFLSENGIIFHSKRHLIMMSHSF